MGFGDPFVDLGFAMSFHVGFFFIAGDGEGLVCDNDGWWRRGSLGVPAVDFYVISLFFRSARLRGWM